MIYSGFHDTLEELKIQNLKFTEGRVVGGYNRGGTTCNILL
jgi:hypothetical protein